MLDDGTVAHNETRKEMGWVVESSLDREQRWQ